MQYPTKLDILLINILCAIHAQQNNAHQSDISVSLERKRDENERREDREDKTVKDTHHHVPGPQSQVLGCKSEVLVLNFMSQAPVGGQGQWTNGQSGSQGAIPSAVFCFRLLHSTKLSGATTS